MKHCFSYIILCCSLWIGCSKSARNASPILITQSASNEEAGHWTAAQLSELITSVPAWSSASFYTDTDWNKILETARIFQQVDSNTLLKAFEDFAFRDTNDFHDDYLEISKPFILLRVVFALPENARLVQHDAPGWLSNGSDLNSDGTINLDWPLTWKGGRPSLLSRYVGYEGPIYKPEADYMTLRRQFAQRDLQRLNVKGIVP